MHLFLFVPRPSDRNAWKDPFVAGEDAREEAVVAGLAFEELGGEFCGGVATAVEEDDGVGVGFCWGDDVDWGFGHCVYG